MDTLRQAFRINVGFLISADIGYARELDFEIDRYRDEDLVLTELAGTIKISRTQQGLFFEGDFNSDVELECSRCLENYQQHITFTFEELFLFKREQLNEIDLVLPDNGQVELGPIIREYAIINFPIQPKCKEDCKGLCVECGVNLNKVDCGHRPEPVNAFSKLLELYDDKDNDKQETE